MAARNYPKLVAAESYTRDEGRGVARIDYDSMDSLGASTGLSVIAIGITAAILFQGNAQPSDTWYLGQGTKKDMFVIYQLQQFDTKNDRPFKMMIYFKDQDSKGN